MTADTPVAPEGGLASPSLGAWMEADHARLDDLWDRAESAWSERREAARALYREFCEGLLRHILAEEEVLFPYYEARSPSTARHLTAMLREEHEQIRSSLETLLAEVDAGIPDLEERTTVLRNVLWAHNTREEGLLYPWFSGGDPESEPKLAAEMRRRLEPPAAEVATSP